MQKQLESKLLPAKVSLLKPEHDNAFFHGYLARVEGLPLDPPSGPLVTAQEWVAGYHTADHTSATGQLNLLGRLLVSDYDAHLGRPGSLARDRYAYHELTNAAFRCDPHTPQVPVLSIELAGQGTYTVDLGERLAGGQALHEFLHEAGVLGDEEDAQGIGAITYHLWTPQQLDALPEWNG